MMVFKYRCNPTKEQLEHILKAEEELAMAGITFDVSHAVDDNWLERHWSLDWSLKGAEVTS
ncbi:hypothetical protein LCGC14_2426320 [marine sediment metagenome]|uniref:Uncharacterized protein n=1 Tax=marine sediment metagenome TaxID=412755 RepID=A0A0F9CAG5_9ZZZZ